MDKRLELKFYVTIDELLKIKYEFNLKKIHQDRIINSIYYDTNKLKFYYEGEEGITPRIKPRIRYYNSDKDNTFFELKKTFDYFRSKYVVKGNNKENTFKKFLSKSNINYNLEPKIKITYKRSYYKSDLGRITVDRDLKFSLFTSNGLNIKKTQYLKVNILEIKNSNLDLKNEILYKIKIKDEKISKYNLGLDSFSQFI